MEYLFSPIQVNQLELKNRIIMPAMHMNMTPEGLVTDQLVNFYAERARGGVALIMIGGCPIEPCAGPFNMVSLKDDSTLEGLKRLTDAVHREGALIGAQMYHAGAYSHSFLSGEQAISATEHQSKFTKEVAREMSREDIEGTIRAFAEAALRARKTGFDVAEIISSAGYLICQFLSPLINKRTDQYGGSWENRMRFGLEVIRACREAVGPDYCLTLRAAGNDYVPESNTKEELSEFYARAANEGLDLINVTGGWHETRVPQITQDLPLGGFGYLARGVKEKVQVPVAVSNRIFDPELAERMLATGFADLISMGRPLITDPALPRKAKDGNFKSIRKCIACNQRCFDAIFNMEPVGCILNPRAGFEEQRKIEATDQPKDLWVVGGGPAGCEAALVAARRGHRVTLFEKTASLGGQVAWFAGPSGKPEFETMTAYFTHMLPEAGVSIKFNHEATAEDIVQGKPDAVLLATGAEPIMPGIPGADLPHVCQAWDLLKGKVIPGKRVVIVGGGSVGCETAIFISKMGTLTPAQLYYLSFFKAETPETLSRLLYQGNHDVTVVEMLRSIGKDIGKSTRWVTMSKIRLLGVKGKTDTKVTAITEAGVEIEDQNGISLLPADTVVLAIGSRPVGHKLAEILTNAGVKTSLIGDADRPLKMTDAILAGFKAGCAL